MASNPMKAVLSICGLAAVSAAALWATPNIAQGAPSQPISLRDTFPIGSNGLCEAQIQSPEEGAGIFDRKYTVVCRDAAAPIGTLWVVRGQFGVPGL